MYGNMDLNSFDFEKDNSCTTCSQSIRDNREQFQDRGKRSFHLEKTIRNFHGIYHARGSGDNTLPEEAIKLTEDCDLSTEDGNKTLLQDKSRDVHSMIVPMGADTTNGFRWREMTCEQIAILLTIYFTYLITWLNLSIPAPIFPREANRKGVNATVSGWVFGVFALVQFIVSPFYRRLLSKFSSRSMLVLGLLVCGVCTISFGLLSLIDTRDGVAIYVLLCFLVRILLAVACTVLSSTGLVMLVQYFPNNVATRFIVVLDVCCCPTCAISSNIIVLVCPAAPWKMMPKTGRSDEVEDIINGIGEIFTGIGLVAGPALGGILYTVSLVYWFMNELQIWFLKMGVIDDCWSAYMEACPCLSKKLTFIRSTRVGLGIILILAIPLQTAGMFTSHWVYNETCSNIGLVYTECGNATLSGSEALHPSAFGLQVVSYIILLLAAISFIGLCCSFRRKDIYHLQDESAIARFCFPCFLPTVSFFAGFFNVISCMVVSRSTFAQEFYEFGYSYYLCLTTGVVTALVSLLFIIGYFAHTYAKTCMCRCHVKETGTTKK